jgi:hypothetical protein
VRVARAGFYTYRERLVGSPAVAEYTTRCALVAETALARPEIHTGRGDTARLAAGAQQPGSAPTRVLIGSLGIDAPVFPARIDLRRGLLAAPNNIARTGWWLDGAAPGSTSGAVLIAGHVDSARFGPGAFFRLRDARRGTRVQVRARNGRSYTYRVTSVQSLPKQTLPTSVYSRQGRPRLVLVTCGGPFLPREGAYRDNVVVTAVPEVGLS